MTSVRIRQEANVKSNFGNWVTHSMCKKIPGPHPRSTMCSTSPTSFPGGRADMAACIKSRAGRILGVKFLRYRLGFQITAILPRGY